jgi:hypothetical protein
VGRVRRAIAGAFLGWCYGSKTIGLFMGCGERAGWGLRNVFGARRRTVTGRFEPQLVVNF